MTLAEHTNAALVIAAHGERAGDMSNQALLGHVDAINRRGIFGCVAGGVLKGTPSVEDALQEVADQHPDRTLVYPLFMSDGYFVNQVLPKRIGAARSRAPTAILAPLGLDAQLPRLFHARTMAVAREAGFEPAQTRLLVVGHGSQVSPASAAATERMAQCLRAQKRFSYVQTAFIEETPFIQDALKTDDMQTVVAGFFSCEGMHNLVDVPGAIEEAGVDAVYTGPIGCDPNIVELICDAAGSKCVQQPAPAL